MSKVQNLCFRRMRCKPTFSSFVLALLPSELRFSDTNTTISRIYFTVCLDFFHNQQLPWSTAALFLVKWNIPKQGRKTRKEVKEKKNIRSEGTKKKELFLRDNKENENYRLSSRWNSMVRRLNLKASSPGSSERGKGCGTQSGFKGALLQSEKEKQVLFL